MGNDSSGEVRASLFGWLMQHGREAAAGAVAETAAQFESFCLLRAAADICSRLGAERFMPVRKSNEYPDADECATELSLLLFYPGIDKPFGDNSNGDLEAPVAFHALNPDAAEGDFARWREAVHAAWRARGQAMDGNNLDDASEAWVNWGEDHAEAEALLGSFINKSINANANDADLVALVAPSCVVAGLAGERLRAAPAGLRARRRG